MENYNALALLAVQVGEVQEVLVKHLGVGAKCLDKAQNVIAELAKVTWLKADPSMEDLAFEGSMPNMIGLDAIVNKCKAIAEE